MYVSVGGLASSAMETVKSAFQSSTPYLIVSMFGGLLAPTKPYLEYVIKLKDIFVRDFSAYTKCDGIMKRNLIQLQSVPVPFTHCSEFPLNHLLKLYLKMRIYYCIEFANRDLSTNKGKKAK